LARLHRGRRGPGPAGRPHAAPGRRGAHGVRRRARRVRDLVAPGEPRASDPGHGIRVPRATTRPRGHARLDGRRAHGAPQRMSATDARRGRAPETAAGPLDAGVGPSPSVEPSGFQPGPPERIGVLGAGSWGTALAQLLALKGHRVRLWCHDPGVAVTINDGRTSSYLPGIDLHPALRAVTDVSAAVADAGVVLSASPSQFVGAIMVRAADHLPPDALLVSASKGIELGTLRRMDEVIGAVVPARAMRRFCVLSGPSFAGEVADGMPTAVVIAGR